MFFTNEFIDSKNNLQSKYLYIIGMVPCDPRYERFLGKISISIFSMSVTKSFSMK